MDQHLDVESGRSHRGRHGDNFRLRDSEDRQPLYPLKQISSTFDEASAMLGGSFLHTMRKITLPIIWPTLISLGVFFFMRAMVTLAAVIFLVTPGNNLAAVSVLLLDDAGETTQAAAFSTLIMVVVLAVLLVFQGLLRLLGIRNVSLIS